MTSRFNSFYFNQIQNEKEIESLEEASFLTKSRYARNLWNILRKSAKRRMRPKDYEDTLPITKWGYADLFSNLTDMYNDLQKENKPFYIKNLFQGQFNPKKDSHEVFGNVVKPVEVSWYRTNKGGNIILYELVVEDEDGDNVTKYFVAIDGKGQKFFAVDRKRGGVGMLFKAWLSAQKIKKNIFPDAAPEAEQKAKQPKIQTQPIEKSLYDKLVPTTESVSINLDEKSKGNKRKENAKIEKQKRDKAEADKEFPIENDPKKEEPKEKKPISPIEKDEGEGSPDKPKPKKKAGELQIKLKGQFDQTNPKPVPITPNKEIASGWTYDLKGNNTIFLFKNKEGEHKIAWKGPNAGNILQKLGYIQRQDVARLK